jgi:uncharacterized protein (DUF58 family)
VSPARGPRSWRHPFGHRDGGLTTTGWAILVGSLAVWGLAWSFGYGELSIVAAAGLISLVVAVVWTGSRPRLDVERELLPDRVMRGDDTEVRAVLSNPGRRATAASLAVDQVGARDVEVILPGVPAHHRAQLAYTLPTDRRGILQVGPLTVVREDPLGLVRRTRGVGGSATLWVYPRTHPVRVVPSGQTRDLEGPTSDMASGSITFHALREYESGDDLRLIHWRSTARTGTLMVRHQADPSRPNCDIVLDVARSSYQDEEAFESAVEAAASIIVASTTHRFPVKLRTTDGLVVDSSRGRAAGQAFLDRLAAVQLRANASLAAAATAVSAGPRGNTLVVLTGEPAEIDLLAVESVRHRFEVVTAVRFHPGEESSATLKQGILELIAPDGRSFAELWNRQVTP